MNKSATAVPNTVSVLIATYCRPQSLHSCLQALAAQSRCPNEVLVIVRREDCRTQDYLSRRLSATLPLRVIEVEQAGAVAARNAGLDSCTSDVVAIIDDDTIPRIDWLQRLMEDFAADRKLGALGGRDRCFDGKEFDDRQAEPVGKIAWYGRAIGNHHLGFGSIREVDFLKGANMSFRMEAVANIRFDSRLRGSGAQPAEDTCFSVAVKSSGWKVSYDPQVLVEHYPAERNEPRSYVGVSKVTDTTSYENFAYNQIVSIWLALSPARRFAFFIWSTLVGTGVSPGLLQAVRFTPKLGLDSWKRFAISQSMKFRAFFDLLTTKPPVNR